MKHTNSSFIILNWSPTPHSFLFNIMTSSDINYTISCSLDPTLKVGVDSNKAAQALKLTSTTSACTWQLIPSNQTTSTNSFYLFHPESHLYLSWDASTNVVSMGDGSKWKLDPGNPQDQQITVTSSSETQAGSANFVLGLNLPSFDQNFSLAVVPPVGNTLSQLWKVNKVKT